jgi:PAS domain-containing protein
MIAPDYRHLFEEYVVNVRERRDIMGLHFKLITQQQGQVEMTVKSMPQNNDIGIFSYIICVGQRCMDLVQTGYDTLGLKSDLQMFVETANSPIIGIDADGLINEWNFRTANISGLTRDDIIGRNFIQVRNRNRISPALSARPKSELIAGYCFQRTAVWNLRNS